MADDSKTPDIKVTDRRHFDRTGEKRPGSEVGLRWWSPARARSAGSPSESDDTGASPRRARRGPSGRPPGPTAEDASRGASPLRAPDLDPGRSGAICSDIATNLSSSFSLLVARLAQETEIYLGLVPYPGKETSEPDLEAARAMIDLLSMLQEKTRGNLEPEEARLLENLLYTYRLEFVRRRPDGGVR